MRDLVIFGAGDLAEVAWAYFSHDSDYSIAAFTVDDQYASAEEFRGRPLVPFSSLLHRYPPQSHDLFVAMGFKNLNHARADVYQRCKSMGYTLATYVSSKISECGHWSVGDNCFILEQNVIQPFVRIGNNVVIWSANHIGHHSVIGDHCFLSSQVAISGRCKIGDYTFMGVNASTAHGVTIGSDCLIGAGANILKDTRDGEFYPGEGAKASRIPALRAARVL